MKKAPNRIITVIQSGALHNLIVSLYELDPLFFYSS